MFKIGDIVCIRSNGLFGIIIEEQGNTSTIIQLDEMANEAAHDYVVTLEQRKYTYDLAKRTVISNDLLDYNSFLDKKILEQVMRHEILTKINEFYNIFHKKNEMDFIPEKSYIPYGGRVYDASEMKNLVDSSLDFWLTGGRFFKKFEQDFAKFLGVRFASLTNSGSSANLLAFSALTSPKLGERRILPGDEVITVAAGFPTTVAPIVQYGAIPVFLDVDLGTYNIQANMIELAITNKTKAIMIAHTMGNPFDLGKVIEIAQKYNLWVIEDNCDALGSTYNGKLTGTFGHIGTSSFYPPHHMTMGEGGAVYTNDARLKVIIESFRDWGRDCWCESGCDNTCGKRFEWDLGTLPHGYDHKYTYSHIGYNLKVTDMQAAIGLEQLKKVPVFTQARKSNFKRLYNGLADLQNVFILPQATENGDPSWFGFLITIKDNVKFKRNEIVSYLESKNIQTRMLFAGNLTRQPAYENVNYRIHGNLTNTDKIMNDTFIVGVYPGLTEKMIDYMIQQIRDFVRNYY